MFEIDLQTEVDRKAYAALERVIDEVESGVLAPNIARRVLAVLQTAFSGIVEDNKDFNALLTDTDALFSNYPKLTDNAFLAYYKKHSDIPEYVIRYDDCSLKISSKGRLVKQKTYELPQECYAAVKEAHNVFIKKGLLNRWNLY